MLVETLAAEDLVGGMKLDKLPPEVLCIILAQLSVADKLQVSPPLRLRTAADSTRASVCDHLCWWCSDSLRPQKRRERLAVGPRWSFEISPVVQRAPLVYQCHHSM